MFRGPSLLEVVWFGSSPTPFPRSLVSKVYWWPQRKTKKERQLADGRERGKGWGRSQIIRLQESQVLYKFFQIEKFRRINTIDRDHRSQLVKFSNDLWNSKTIFNIGIYWPQWSYCFFCCLIRYLRQYLTNNFLFKGTRITRKVV